MGRRRPDGVRPDAWLVDAAMTKSTLQYLAVSFASVAACSLLISTGLKPLAPVALLLFVWGIAFSIAAAVEWVRRP